jgi:hypothetical protein
MEDGVIIVIGINVQHRVMEDSKQELEHVTIHYLLMVVMRAMENHLRSDNVTTTHVTMVNGEHGHHSVDVQ